MIPKQKKSFTKDYSKYYLTVIIICSLMLIAIFIDLTAKTTKTEPYFPEYRTRIAYLEGRKCIQFSIYNRESNTITDGFLLID